MNTIDKSNEKRLIGAIDRAITLSNGGLTPTEAITKVATEENFGPPFIERMVQAFNKSKSMHRLKEATADTRHEPFSIADADEVIRNVYGGEMAKAASVECDGFDPTFSFDMMKHASMQKAASAPVKDKLTREEIADAKERAKMLLKQADLTTAVRDKLKFAIATHKHAFHRALDDASELMRPLAPREFRKVAQAVVNGYPRTGKQLMSILAQKMRRDQLDLQKTANAVVFPPREPYLTINKIHEHAEKLASAENDFAVFEKEALNFFANTAANALANLATGDEDRLGESLQGGSRKGTLDHDEVLDPKFYNKLKELDAFRSLMNLILYDDNLKDYKSSDVIKAYNDAIGSVPEAVSNPVVLRSLVMRNLESSGLKDVVELSQEQQLRRGLSDASKAEGDLRRSEELPNEEAPDKKPAINLSTRAADLQKALQSGKIRGSAAELLGAAAGTAAEGAKKATKGDEAGDLEQWRQMAINKVLKGGNPQQAMDMNILGNWRTNPDGSQQTHAGFNPAMSIDDIAKDLRTMHTKPRNEWGGETAARLQNQYGVTQ